MKEPSSEICTSTLCDVVGVAMTLLQVGQVIPQHCEMYADKSTAGLSPWLLFFGSLYSYLAFIDVLMSGGSKFACGAGPYRCFMSAQPFIQMLLTAIFTSGLWFWFLRYYENSEDDSAPVISGESPLSCLGRTCNNLFPPQVFFQLALACSGFATLVAVAIGFAGTPQTAARFGYLCGNLAAVLNAVMWLPQILLTVCYGHRGALSVHWVIATIVMDVVYSVYLAEMGLDMSVWLNNIPDGVQTTILLGILIYYERRDKDRGMNDFGVPIAAGPVGTYGAIAVPEDSED